MASLCSRRRPRGAASLGHVAWSRHGVLTGLPWACCSGHPWARSSCQDQASPSGAVRSPLTKHALLSTSHPLQPADERAPLPATRAAPADAASSARWCRAPTARPTTAVPRAHQRGRPAPAPPTGGPPGSLRPAPPAPSRPAGRRQRPTRSESPAVVPRRVARSGEEVHIHPRLMPLDRIAAVHGQPLIRLSRLVQQPSQRRVILVSHRSILVRAVLSPRRRERGARPAKCLALPPSAPGFPAGRPVCSAGGILRPARREARDRCGNPTISGSHADAVWIAVVRPTV